MLNLISLLFSGITYGIFLFSKTKVKLYSTAVSLILSLKKQLTNIFWFTFSVITVVPLSRQSRHLSFCCSVSSRIKVLRLKGKFGVGISDARKKEILGVQTSFSNLSLSESTLKLWKASQDNTACFQVQD